MINRQHIINTNILIDKYLRKELNQKLEVGIYKDNIIYCNLLNFSCNNIYSVKLLPFVLLGIELQDVSTKYKIDANNNITQFETNSIDIDKSYKEYIMISNYTDLSYAKVNIFLKIAGKRGNYHLIASRFVRVKGLYDSIKFEYGNFSKFTIDGKFGCSTQQNTIYKAYLALNNISSSVNRYFTKHKVVVDKNIPEFAGLGGGSSNCATFILMINDVCNLKLSKDQLANIGANIGADVPFFIYEYDSANVTGIGEVVTRFDEEILNIEVVTPKIKCDTKDIFCTFRDKFYNQTDQSLIDELMKTKSKDIYRNINIYEANDLYKPALTCNNKLIPPAKDFYFSGTGSSFFRIK